jgi:hypothetical protein
MVICGVVKCLEEERKSWCAAITNAQMDEELMAK